jgi:hypothetical protein
MIDLYKNKEVLTLTIEGKNYEIKLQGTTDKPYFCGKDVCNILGYVDIKQALQNNVKPNHKLMLKELYHADGYNSEPETSVIKLGVDTTNIGYHDGKAIYISKEGFEMLMMKSRVVRNKSLTKAIVDACDLNLNYIIDSKEQDCIGKIIQVFKHEKFRTQFRVQGYKIDLYFYEKKIAIECDEFGHSDRDQEYEEIRQLEIETTLGCRFIRFNPDDKCFNIFSVINEIVWEMY